MNITHRFTELTQIPRGSGNEKEIADYLEAFAHSHGLYCFRDEANNIFIKKDGFGKSVVLQGHSDMVCEKNEGCSHNFDTDPISLIRSGSILSADGTTLGADDGISIAVMLELLEDSEITSPIECLITTGEEVGLCGMKAFELARIESRYMVNLDSMDEGVATVSCAGGVRSDIFLPAENRKSCAQGYLMKLGGLYGGHSGEDINEGRLNAISSALSILSAIGDSEISSISGGSKDNAIPRECNIIFTSNCENVSELIESEAKKFIPSLTEADRNFFVKVEKTDVSSTFGRDFTERLLTLASSLSLGVIEMSESIPGMVKTSANLGIARTADGVVKLTVSSRSSDEKKLDVLQAKIEELATANGGYATHRDRYPGWDFEKESKVRDTYLCVYGELFGKSARYEGIHAGLECGIVKAAIPDMDIISIGADIKSPHTPSETLDLDSLDRLYVTVKELIKRISA